jgi:hypothetical protein
MGRVVTENLCRSLYSFAKPTLSMLVSPFYIVRHTLGQVGVAVGYRTAR